METLHKLLSTYWGYDDFRPNQLEIIQSVINKNDVLAILPTGGGKSLCYQLPALYLPGVCIVVSPLIALMHDQILQLQAKGISATYIHGQLSSDEIIDILENTVNGVYKLVYLAPERLNSKLFLSFLPDINVSFIAVDEAHCISQWGHDFRPLYLKIAALRPYFPHVKIIALTASATTEVQADIKQYLSLVDPVVFQESIYRSNISYQVAYSEAKLNDMISIFENQNGVGIVYCRSRKRCEQIALQLKSQDIDAAYYHAGLHKSMREKILNDWLLSDRQVICATTAFGMGIDKPNVSNIIHVDLPENLEAYYQEVGRAGRNGAYAKGVVLYTPKDINYLKEKTIQSFPEIQFVKSVYSKIFDYLNIAVGDGFETTYAFQLLDFAHKFKLPVIPTMASIKLLERSSYFVWNENNTIAATIMIIQSADRLQQLKTMHPKYYAVIDACLRLYGSLYTYATPIDPFKIARLLAIDKLQLDKYFIALHEIGFIDYKSESSGGSIFFLENRLPNNFVQIDTQNYKKQQQHAYYKTTQLITYIENTKDCRSQLLAFYFGEKAKKACGICDNCLSKNRKKWTLQDFQNALMHSLKKQGYMEVNNIELLNLEMDKGELFNYLRMLIDKGIVVLKDTRVYKQK